MILPDQAYVLSELDLTKTRSQLVRQYVNSTQASATISVTAYTVPEGYCLFVQQLNVLYSPNAAQNIVVRTIFARIDGTAYYINRDNSALAAGVAASLLAAPPIGMFPAGTEIMATGAFNSGVANNSVTISLLGWLVPKGGLAI